jgi:NAD(P)-dependent dehydrogenase (short-subunit alcohol dehydrogenase family)
MMCHFGFTKNLLSTQCESNRINSIQQQKDQVSLLPASQQTYIMSLNGMRVFVAGATGEVGRGAAFALNQQGAFVYLAGRSQEKLRAIQDLLSDKSKSEIVAIDYSTVAGSKELQTRVNAMPKFDVVVASSGPWWPVARLASDAASIDILYKAVQSSLSSQMFLYHVLVRRCTGHYIMINGSAALNIPQVGLTGILAHACMGAALLMNEECNKGDTNFPSYTHVMLSSSVGHTAMRGDTTHDPNEYGKAFVAMALGKHESQRDKDGTLWLDDDLYSKLVAM